MKEKKGWVIKMRETIGTATAVDAVTEADEGRCLAITPSAAHCHLPPFAITQSGDDGRERSYYFRDYFRLYYVLRGYVSLSADENGARLGYGDIAIVPPDRAHKVKLCTAETRLYECSFTIGLVEDILRTQAGTGGTLSSLFNADGYVVIQPVPADLQIHLQHLMDFLLYEAGRPNGQYAVKNMLASLLCVFSDLYRAQESAPEAAEKNSIVYALHYIKRNFASPLTIDGMATLTSMSRKDFCSRFKRFTGKTLHEYLNGERIRHAIEVISAAGGNVSLTALAVHCGYTDYATFYRNFLRIVGASPAAYIEKWKSGSALQ